MTPTLPKSIVELKLIKHSRKIREESSWETELENPYTCKRWIEDAKKDGLLGIHIEYLFKELDYLATLGTESAHLSLTHGIYESFIGGELELDFIRKACSLEFSLRSSRNLHPDDNETAWFIIDPSLYCLVWNLSRGMDQNIVEPLRRLSGGWCGTGCRDYYKYFSCQWLPCEISVNTYGMASIDSYINNLHPGQHKSLYPVIGKVFSSFIPLFEKVLTNSINIPENTIVYDDTNSKLIVPNEYVPPHIEKLISLQDSELQVIVSMINIELTPQKPSYAGGDWHVEGTIRERIVASGIYYYRCENITESRIEFRNRVYTLKSNSAQQFFDLDCSMNAVPQVFGSVVV